MYHAAVHHIQRLPQNGRSKPPFFLTNLQSAVRFHEVNLPEQIHRYSPTQHQHLPVVAPPESLQLQLQHLLHLARLPCFTQQLASLQQYSIRNPPASFPCFESQHKEELKWRSHRRNLSYIPPSLPFSHNNGTHMMLPTSWVMPGHTCAGR